MSGMYLATERRIAIEAVQTACTITTKVFQHLVSSESVTKKDKSPVTIGDYSAQAAVNYVLSRAFPQDGIVGEETADDLRTMEGVELRAKVTSLVNEALQKHEQVAGPLPDSEILDTIDLGTYSGGADKRFWALDPIDGTKGFLRGGQYAVCLALLVNGRVELGVMGCPNLPLDPKQPKPRDGEIRDRDVSGLGALFVCVRGQGSYVRPICGADAAETPIQMRDLQGSFKSAGFCESVEAGHSSLATNQRIARILGMDTERSVRMDSQAKYASIARGDGDVYLRLPVGDGSYQEKIWDHAAGTLLVEEAGGTVSDIAGRALDFRLGRTLKANRGVVACSKDMHPTLVEAVADALHEEGRASLLEAP
ncbi:3'(2'),5'-bisphosphate nucleotidase [Malassezia vespertilionis]|uniref:3'(2'),5'-bisphosphate nucleotidase n=1 Tax=Malassezia vespertilionis TaxID=2020962 RepID=A0A2N1J7I2_9BASI|nr:3'(2'),5'-bisphosphate nucleotidase [Malassezia vespertilionis]PKI82509.1 hypothetical protein MVES_003628 [Malassezia vespertilionis]WFD08018.1 3'(2'),5'-bisphosphate nucleotidase [Malassezia vespertilionis]